MAFSDSTQTNWGCILSAIISVPIGLFIFLIGSLSGGGCEGRDQPCDGDYTPMWAMLGVLLIAGALLAKLVNFVINCFRNRSA